MYKKLKYRNDFIIDDEDKSILKIFNINNFIKSFTMEINRFQVNTDSIGFLSKLNKLRLFIKICIPLIG